MDQKDYIQKGLFAEALLKVICVEVLNAFRMERWVLYH